MIKAVIFDFDGTIADSFDVAFEVGMQLLQENGYDVSITKEDIRHSTLGTLRHRYNISMLKVLRILPRARNMVAARADELQPFSGITQVVRELNTSYKIAVVSSSGSMVEAFLRKHRIKCERVVTGVPLTGKARRLRGTARSLNVHPSEAVYIGDEVRDIEAARSAGMRVIAVTWGFNDEKLLAQHAPDAIARQPSDIPVLIRKVS